MKPSVTFALRAGLTVFACAALFAVTASDAAAGSQSDPAAPSDGLHGQDERASQSSSFVAPQTGDSSVYARLANGFRFAVSMAGRVIGGSPVLIGFSLPPAEEDASGVKMIVDDPSPF